MTTLDESNYVLSTDGTWSVKVACHCHCNVDTGDSVVWSEEVLGVCYKATAIDGAPLTDGVHVLSFETRDSVEVYGVSARADDLYVAGPAGVYGCGMLESPGALECADTSIGMSGKVSGGVLGGHASVCVGTAVSSC